MIINESFITHGFTLRDLEAIIGNQVIYINRLTLNITHLEKGLSLLSDENKKLREEIENLTGVKVEGMR